MQTILLIWQSLNFFTYLLITWLISGHNCWCLFGGCCARHVHDVHNQFDYLCDYEPYMRFWTCMYGSWSINNEASWGSRLISLKFIADTLQAIASHWMASHIYEHGIQWHMIIASHNQLHSWFWICSLDMIDGPTLSVTATGGAVNLFPAVTTAAPLKYLHGNSKGVMNMEMDSRWYPCLSHGEHDGCIKKK